MRIQIESLSESYEDICKAIINDGERVAPRGLPTREIIDAVIELTDVTQALPLGINRKLNIAIGFIEAAQLIGGFSDPALVCAVSPQFKQFMNSGTFHGPYGLRTNGQIELAIERLRRSPDTRQAVITIWNPLQDLLVDDAHDYPCTIMLQFLIRNDKLVMHTTMRSNDVWRGLAYDMFQFTQLQQCVANVLGLDCGSYYHHAVSMHLYESDIDAVDSLTRPQPDVPKFTYSGLGGLGRYQTCDFPEVKKRIRAICQNETPGAMTVLEQFYKAKLQKALDEVYPK